ncbi:hypothetical protein HNR05_001410 [Leifsonia psychrotolerans]|uniref:Uncharacterized protein n=1 Tax=Glaciibacter psychrotolerans TaxID=670054 RepID=A0A7Z0EEQ7_9MICO|nr:hypothetical protein [Leifsonia psychrotolerans]NYJ19619.1 hypothetical protein [Leifsonia psychrotolerans]
MPIEGLEHIQELSGVSVEVVMDIAGRLTELALETDVFIPATLKSEPNAN